jgi:hypothetical protein
LAEGLQRCVALDLETKANNSFKLNHVAAAEMFNSQEKGFRYHFTASSRKAVNI